MIDASALGFGDQVNATVTAAEVQPCSYDPDALCDVITAEVTSGAPTGDSATLTLAARSSCGKVCVGGRPG